MQELLNNIIYNIIIKVIAQEVLNKDGIGVIVQEEQLTIFGTGYYLILKV